MKLHEVRSHPSRAGLQREEQLAWKIAAVAADRVAVPRDTVEMIINRLIDNAAVAVAALNRGPVIAARDMATGHPCKGGATLLGLKATTRVSPEWAAWANGTAVRALDMHDTFLAASEAHPGDTIPPILAVGQLMEKSGRDLIRAIATGYEIQINLARGICLHEHGIDPVAHLAPAQAAGIGTLLKLPAETICQAVQQAVHTGFTTAQAGTGEDSTWQAFAPGHAGKLAVEAIDRAMRGQGSPGPIYEGEVGVIARMLNGRTSRDRGFDAAPYHVPLPEQGEAKRSILSSFTREHAGPWQSQALIDLALRMREEIDGFDNIARIVIHTSHHIHATIGTGANDPQTPDRSIPYIFAVALQDGVWHHEDSTAPRRAARADTMRLRQRIETREDPEWTRRGVSRDPAELAFGARVEITMRDGSVVTDEMAVANAHPHGARPFEREDYIHKFLTLTQRIITTRESNRFLEAVQNLAKLQAGDLHLLNVSVPAGSLEVGRPGLF